MNANQTGSSRSYARFRDAQAICTKCFDFGVKEYGATYADRSAFIALPLRTACDVCGEVPAMFAVSVCLPPFAETPQAIRFFGEAAACGEAKS